MFILIFQILFLIFLLGFSFWLISMIISSLTRAPYVVTAIKAIEAAFFLAKPKKDEIVYDLGCGDGRVLIYAAKNYQTNGIGYDISPFCVLKARWKVFVSGLSKKIKIEEKSLFRADLKNADIIFLYNGTEIMSRLEKYIFDELKPTARIVSLAFSFENHHPIATKIVRQLGKKTKVFLYKKTNY